MVLYSFDSQWKTKRPIYQRALDNICKFLEDVLQDAEKLYSSRAKLEHRVKKKRDILAKAKQNGIPEEQVFQTITDIAGARVVCNNIQDIYTILHAIEKRVRVNGDIRIVGRDDKVIIPTDKGYRAYHLDMIVKCIYSFRSYDIPCEVQLQTLAQNMWCVLSHIDVYRHKDVPAEIKNIMVSLGNYLAGADHYAQMIREQRGRIQPGEFKEVIAGTTDIDFAYLIRKALERQRIGGIFCYLQQIHADNLRRCGVSSKREVEEIAKDEESRRQCIEIAKKYRGCLGHSEVFYFSIVYKKLGAAEAEKLIKDYLESWQELLIVRRLFYDVPSRA